MILLLGGTSETRLLANALAEAGFDVLVSTATDIRLDVGDNPKIVRRSGPLDAEALSKIIHDKGIRTIVDAAHPFASIIHSNVIKIAKKFEIPCLVWERAESSADYEFVFPVSTHVTAAKKAFKFGSPVLLTIGSKNLLPYVSESKKSGVPLVARVLDHPDSVASCLKAGIPAQHVITGRGPFSIAENTETIKTFGIGTIVTKDSGPAGGVPEKIEAARLENCRVVLIQRPRLTGSIKKIHSVKELIKEVKKQ